MAKHMNGNDRCRIGFLLGLRWPVSEIAADRGRPDSTIQREILNRRVRVSRGYGCSNRVCANYDTCSRIRGCGNGPKGLFRTTPKCFTVCPEFREAVCTRLGSSPHVCNGCERFHSRQLKKRLYVADSAQANYTGTLRKSRSGVHPDNDRVAEMNKTLPPCILRNQSVRHVMACNAEIFKGIAERTVYGYIKAGLFDANASDLPFAGRRKPETRKAETKTNAKCRVGRTHDELIAYRKANPDLSVVEMGTVIGQVGGKALFTFQFNDCGLMLAFLRDAGTAQTRTRIVNLLREIAGPVFFREIFAIIVTDNGPEFSDPDGIELYRPDPVHNSTKRAPRGIRLFHCDPYCSSQKPHVERNHREVRRILGHGTSFDALVQQDVDLAMSHVNSHTRDWLGGKPPCGVFVERHGERGKEFLDRLGIRRIPGNQVTLDPILLGMKSKRHADKVVMERYGVKKSDRIDIEK